MDNEKVPTTAVEPAKKTPKVEAKKPLNIFEKLLAITSELTTVAKNLEVGTGNNTYKAVSEVDVLRAVRPLEAKYGVYSYPFSRNVIESGSIESTNYKGEVKKQLFERIEVVYRFVNVENPNEFVDITTYGDGIDSGDKSVGKAMTYADKYALLKAYKIMTGDDPDANASEDLNTTKIVKEPLNPELIEKLTKVYGVHLEQVATYLRKSVDDLTNSDLKSIIARKEKNANRG